MAFAEISDRIVANVNGEIILLSDLRQQMVTLKNLEVQGEINTPKGGITEESVLQMMVDEKMMSYYAKESNITIKESEIDKAVENFKAKNGLSDKALAQALERQNLTLTKYRETLKNQMLIRRVTSYEITGVDISDEDVKDYYDQNIGEFMSEEKIRVSHIAVALPLDSGPMLERIADEKVKSIKEEIASGTGFSQLARKYSEDSAAQSGGDLGWFKRGKMLPEMEDVAFSLRQGETGGPVRTPFGLHLIKVTERQEPKPIALDKAANGIRGKLHSSLYQKKRTAWIERLRDQAYIEVLY